MINVSKRAIAVVGILSLFIAPMSAGAAPSTDLTQVITAGTLSVDILDASRVAVAAPTAAMTAKTFSFDCQFGGSASTGTFGTNTQRIYASNPSAATPNGWNVTMAATAGPTGIWANTGTTKTYDFNDAGGTGCTDGADADALSGQMTVNPTAGTLTTDYSGSSVVGITKGSSTSFVEGTTNSVTLLAASNTAPNPWRGYLTGTTISQSIPAEQGVDATYKINMTMTITAL